MAQTYSAAEVTFDRHDRLLFNTGLTRRRSHLSDLTIFLENGADVSYKSGEVLHNLRNETLDGCVIDECRQQQKELWTQIILPMLARHNGWCDFKSTPNGFDWFYDLYRTAKDVNPEGEWATFHAPSTECWWWDEKQIAQARASMTESEFRQEILAEFLDLYQGQVYSNFSEANISSFNPFLTDNRRWTSNIPVVLGADFNTRPMAWVLGQQRVGQFYWFDEIYIPTRTNTVEAAKVLIEKIKPMHIRVNPQVIIAGDPAGQGTSTKTSIAGETDYVMLCQELDRAGITWENRTQSHHPGVKDRVNTVNLKLKAADGTTNMWFHPDAKYAIEDMRRVTWKEGANGAILDKSDADRTHASDAVGYPVMALDPMVLTGHVGGLRVITR